MAIKMRNNTDDNSICCECGKSKMEVLDMFDLCIGGTIFTICDLCNSEVLSKALKAECLKNGRTKTSRDMSIIRKRKENGFWERHREREARNDQTSFNGE